MTDKEIKKFLAKYSVQQTTKYTARIGAVAWIVMLIAGMSVPAWLIWTVLASLLLRLLVAMSMGFQYMAMSRRFATSFVAAGTR
jgi:hypothetical protein